ncbi:cell wall integrity and stress response component 3-like isoform X1 [Lytechinus variegatus]|uniref:cell wall integrity and stress response component 3-like isoform X1 n=1 Tax=Lytechinus variegatus TaxID=7654 RepID=UPI001BB29347|nr:cell wall integrity and stress response component 3-like isoform X1 [Lytechinus variegatus]
MDRMWSGRIIHYLLVALMCESTPRTVAITDIRLVDGASPNEGRLEIDDPAQGWGTVCSTGWGVSETEIICRELGFPGANAFVFTNSPFGQSNLPILINNVDCYGNESSLNDCYFDEILTRCTHQSDVGIICHKPGYIGCFGDSFERIFQGASLIDTVGMTIDVCLEFCRNQSFKYAGLEYASECYCADADTQYDVHGTYDDSECQYICMGNTLERCGGLGRISVFDTTVGFCEDPGEPEYGTRQGDWFRYGASVTFDCAEGYTLIGNRTIQCLTANGSPAVDWDADTPMCVGPTDIPTTNAPSTAQPTTESTTGFFTTTITDPSTTLEATTDITTSGTSTAESTIFITTPDTTTTAVTTEKSTQFTTEGITSTVTTTTFIPTTGTTAIETTTEFKSTETSTTVPTTSQNLIITTTDSESTVTLNIDTTTDVTATDIGTTASHTSPDVTTTFQTTTGDSITTETPPTTTEIAEETTIDDKTDPAITESTGGTDSQEGSTRATPPGSSTTEGLIPNVGSQEGKWPWPPVAIGLLLGGIILGLLLILLVICLVVTSPRARVKKGEEDAVRLQNARHSPVRNSYSPDIILDRDGRQTYRRTGSQLAEDSETYDNGAFLADDASVIGVYGERQRAVENPYATFQSDDTSKKILFAETARKLNQIYVPGSPNESTLSRGTRRSGSDHYGAQLVV